MESTRIEPQRAGGNEADASGVSWPAVWAGGFVTAALSLILIALGTGLGVASMSIWSGSGVSTATVSVRAVVWLIATQLISASMGGYLAGRLRTKWAGIHSDEVYFRDTAHGFLAWSVAFVVSAALLTSAATTLVGASETRTQASNGESDSSKYFVDSLLRSGDVKADVEVGSAGRDAAGVFLYGLQHGELSSGDKSYLTQLVMTNASISQAEANKRVTDAFVGAQNAAEAGRKAVAHGLLWTFVALLIGAFSASVAGTIGGRQRDRVVLI